MMCNWCEPDGWHRRTCSICGVGSQAFVSISFETYPNEDFGYTTTDLCRKCWEKHGVEAAMAHRSEVMGIET
jgi:hypothetical protein